MTVAHGQNLMEEHDGLGHGSLGQSGELGNMGNTG